MWERDRDERLGQRLTENCYIDHIQSPTWYFCFSAGGYYFHHGWRPGRLLLWLDCPFDWRLTNWTRPTSTFFCEYSYFVSGYSCIYNFITPRLSSYPSGCQPTWLTSAALLFTLMEHPVLEIPYWRDCQWSICNSKPLNNETNQTNQESGFLIVFTQTWFRVFLHQK